MRRREFLATVAGPALGAAVLPSLAPLRADPPEPPPAPLRLLDSLYGRDIQMLELSFARHLERGETDIVAVDLDLDVPRPRSRSYGVIPRTTALDLLRSLDPRPVGSPAAEAVLARPVAPADLLTLCGVRDAAGDPHVRVYRTPVRFRVDPFGPPRPAPAPDLR